MFLQIPNQCRADQPKQGWLANLVASRTRPIKTFTLKTRRPDLPPEPSSTFRNPIIFARELKAEMEAEGLNQTELAKNMGVTRARISQWLSLLRLPEEMIADLESLGDNWTRRIVTERQLRKLKNAGVHGLKRSQHHTVAYSCRSADIQH